MFTFFTFFKAKPLIPLQTDWDAESEKRFLTCYMFPQRPIEMYEEGTVFFFNWNVENK